MYDNLEPEEHVNDLWEDMERLNALYEELMWDTFDTVSYTHLTLPTNREV